MFSRAIELEGVWPIGGGLRLIPLVGGQPLYSRLPGEDADCAFEASVAWARPGSLGAKTWGRGRAGGECWFRLGGRSRFENWGAAVRWCGYLADKDRDGTEVGAQRRERRGLEITCCLFRMGGKLEGVK